MDSRAGPPRKEPSAGVNLSTVRERGLALLQSSRQNAGLDERATVVSAFCSTQGHFGRAIRFRTPPSYVYVSRLSAGKAVSADSTQYTHCQTQTTWPGCPPGPEAE